ncbi:MAG: MBL fold metallo-hydrolase [Ilumatobacteraceae bacterium]
MDFTLGPSEIDLDVTWRHGVPGRRGAGEPPIQVHAVDPHTYILRQSKSVSFEAPFMYLLFGTDRALLLDTGATADPARFPLRHAVDQIVDDWLHAHPCSSYELVVAHSHAHRDHIAGDPQFTDRADTTRVDLDLQAVTSFFEFPSWPDGQATFDLGVRPLILLGTPGHHPAAITVYDRRTGFLLTGDSVYPGRLYCADMTAYTDSLDRLASFVDGHPISHVMGCHIEMSTTPGRDYPLGTRYQPHEPALQMTTEQLLDVRAAAHAATQRGIHVHNDFVIVNGTGLRSTLELLARTARQRLHRADR